MWIHKLDNVEIDLTDGHKYARQDLQVGDLIIKYGNPIGHATAPIRKGEHIHTHNTKSNLAGVLDYEYNPDFKDVEKNIEEKPVQQVVKTYSKPSAQKTVKNEETPVFDQIVVQEGSVVEEAEPDYGIRKVGDTVEITREFKVKSPVKYSFKDFGILDKVTTK